VQQYPFSEAQAVQLPDWQLFVRALADDVLHEQSPKQLLKIRSKLCAAARRGSTRTFATSKRPPVADPVSFARRLPALPLGALPLRGPARLRPHRRARTCDDNAGTSCSPTASRPT
jgi:hypothetical protein